MIRYVLLAFLMLQVHPEEARRPASANSIEMRATPRMQNVNLSQGCSAVRVTVVIRGPETEEWYCPKVTWTRVDGTRSVEQSDCQPFEHRNECDPPRGNECALDWHVERGGHFVVDNNPCDCTVPGFPRTWHLDECVPENPGDDPWRVRVELSHGNHSLAAEAAEFWVR